MNQSDFAAAGGRQKRAQIHYEADENSPDAAYLEALAALGVDVAYVVTGKRGSESRGPAAAHKAIDGELMERVFVLLDRTAAQKGKRWTEERKIRAAVDVYNFLIQDTARDDGRIEQVLRLVVNHQ